MADIDATSFSPRDEERLWAELESCISAQCDSHESIDDALRTWLDLSTKLRDRSPQSHEEVVVCAQMLLDSCVFQENKEYVRTQIIHSLLQEDEAGPLHAIVCLLLLDGHLDETTFTRMIAEACFPRLLELISSRQDDEDPRLHRFLLQLMYEMSRMERLKVHDLAVVDDDFIHSLFRIIEGISNDIHDPYHYPTIRVLLVLNEQYMLASTDLITNPGSAPEPLTNRIVKCLSLHGPLFRTFGENIILLLNRETETSLQLLILKLLYLLFTTRATYEYFYTNDLRVLLDVIIRNLMDLPDERMALRHTYLRVLYPLLAHTQMNQPPHYKKDEVIRLLTILRGSHNAHFAPADETTLRLVDRVAKVKWLEEDEEEDEDEKEGEDEEDEEGGGGGGGGEGDEKDEATKETSGQAEVARKLLGISLSPRHSASNISVSDVAAVMEKPGVQTPSRNNSVMGGRGDCNVDGNRSSITDEVTKPGTTRAKKPLPTVPKHRHGVPFTQTATVHIAGGVTAKKIPPKAPPPRRRGRVKAPETTPAEAAVTGAVLK